MPKALSISGIVVAILLLLVFGLNVTIGFPFQKSTAMDYGALVASALLAYISWTTFREQP